jgi:hypothetical protein
MSGIERMDKIWWEALELLPSTDRIRSMGLCEVYALHMCFNHLGFRVSIGLNDWHMQRICPDDAGFELDQIINRWRHIFPIILDQALLGREPCPFSLQSPQLFLSQGQRYSAGAFSEPVLNIVRSSEHGT